jgi:hypothetical protein
VCNNSIDVAIDMAGTIARADAVSSLGGGVWQANLLLDQPLAPGSAIRVRLGDGEWSAVLPAREMR